MSLNEALRFIERYRGDRQFRDEAYETDSPQSFLAWISSRGFDFSCHQAGDAFRSLKLRARDEDEAAEIDELKSWFALMLDADLDNCSQCSGCSGAHNKGEGQ